MSPIVWVFIGVGAFCLIVGLMMALGHAAAPHTPEEQASEDAAQMAELSEWRHRRGR